MDKQSVYDLMTKWSMILEIGSELSTQKATGQPGGLSGRISRTTGYPVIFDSKTHKQQLEIQKRLCAELPRWADLIQSQPAIMDGHQWNRKDFIELYYAHYRLVLDKLRQVMNRIASTENISE